MGCPKPLPVPRSPGGQPLRVWAKDEKEQPPFPGAIQPSDGASERAALKADIGLRVPIEVLPPHNAAGLSHLTILSGHTRSEILVELDYVMFHVRVRHDLAKATRSEVDKYFLADNFARRQLDPLDRARAAVRLFELERDKRGRKTGDQQPVEGELRNRIGDVLGLSGRNLRGT